MNVSLLLSEWSKENRIPCVLKKSLTSTNDFAKNELTKKMDSATIYIAEEQTQGRGRGKNHWLTPGKNNSLLTSWVFPLITAPQPITSPLIGLCLYRAVKSAWPKLKWSVKAPNDLRLNNKKIAGLLIEVVQQAQQYFLIVGLGFNLLSHPDSLLEATHLNSTDGIHGDLDKKQLFKFFDLLLSEFLSSLDFIVKPKMSEQQCQELSEATGAIRVSPLGDIEYSGHRISWKDL